MFNVSGFFCTVAWEFKRSASTLLYTTLILLRCVFSIFIVLFNIIYIILTVLVCVSNEYEWIRVLRLLFCPFTRGGAKHMLAATHLRNADSLHYTQVCFPESCECASVCTSLVNQVGRSAACVKPRSTSPCASHRWIGTGSGIFPLECPCWISLKLVE